MEHVDRTIWADQLQVCPAWQVVVETRIVQLHAPHGPLVGALLGDRHLHRCIVGVGIPDHEAVGATIQEFNLDGVDCTAAGAGRLLVRSRPQIFDVQLERSASITAGRQALKGIRQVRTHNLIRQRIALVDKPFVVGKGTTARYSALRAALDGAVFPVWIVGALCITKGDPHVGGIVDAVTGIPCEHPAGLCATVRWLGNVFDGKVQLGHVLVNRVEHGPVDLQLAHRNSGCL